jgi:hypothetical protein
MQQRLVAPGWVGPGSWESRTTRNRRSCVAWQRRGGEGTFRFRLSGPAAPAAKPRSARRPYGVRPFHQHRALCPRASCMLCCACSTCTRRCRRPLLGDLDEAPVDVARALPVWRSPLRFSPAIFPFFLFFVLSPLIVSSTHRAAPACPVNE